MGFTVPTTETTVLELRYDKYPGLEVRARSITMADAIKMDADMAFKAFPGALVSWNCELPDGTPVPATAEGYASLEARFARDILFGWSDALSEVDTPLGQRSTAGLPWEAVSIPTEVLSVSPES